MAGAPPSEAVAAGGKKNRRRRARELPEEDPEFQIAPMIDILLVLLVFFMSISSTEVLKSTRGIELPIATEAGKRPKEKPSEVIVNVGWTAVSNVGNLSVNERKYATPDELVPLLQERIARDPRTRVLIRADKATRYEYLRTVMLAIGNSGVANVTFSVVDKEGQQK